MTSRPPIRCAIYTRKSSEEGLDQDFNSLDAQREAGEAYIRSQAHEGWKCLPTRYDDGGHSGGTMERPALRQLMEDIRERRLDVIVIYKIDRLTRSLADFARLAELFDQYGVSFVSVTQQFNTTTSMGRLMLNVLLSFAQFEREITGERIRDKIAASKKKGMWMGGTVPIGYRTVDRSLVIEEAEADAIRTIFRLYLESGDVPALMPQLERLNIRTRPRVVAGRETGGLPIGRGHLYQLLSNPVYIGQIKHKKLVYPGAHEAIIEHPTWDAVQALLASNTQGGRQRRRRAAADPSPLAGILFADNGNRFTTSHANKGGLRYRYYVEEIDAPAEDGPRVRRRRIPAIEIERVVREAIVGFLTAPRQIINAIGSDVSESLDDAVTVAARLSRDLERQHAAEWPETIEALVQEVVFSSSNVQLLIGRSPLRSLLGIHDDERPNNGTKNETFELDLSVSIRTRGTRTKIVTGQRPAKSEDADPALLKAVARAHEWFGWLKTGEVNSIDAIAKAERLTSSYVARVLPLAFLSPPITEQIVAGLQPFQLTAQDLINRTELPITWTAQTRIFGAS